MKVLVELRPAFDRHGGIPQETRLLFRSLAQLEGVEVQGLIQSSNLVVEPGLPGEASALPESQRIDRLSKVVMSLQQGPSSHRLEHWRKRLLRWMGVPAAVLGSLLGRKLSLTHFDPAPFKDFVWRSMFARTLTLDDFDLVTTRRYRVLRWPWALLNAIGVATGLLGRSLYPRLDTQGLDVMVVETPYPGRVRQGTQLVVRYHDAIPMLMPYTIKDRGLHRAMHWQALKRNAADGAWFACVSEATRQDLISLLPDVAPRAVTIPNLIAPQFGPTDEDASRVPEIIWSRKNRHAPHGGGAALPAGGVEPLRYLLMVSTLEPRKNHLTLLDAWELLRARGHDGLQLVCVGGLGWEHGAILERLGPWLERGGVHLLHDVPADDLKLLYHHAAATVCPSFGEGFDFSGVEAMQCGGVVVASDIPVHREVYADAAEYCSPYAAQDMAAAIARVLDPEALDRRARLRQLGAANAARFSTEAVLPAWADLLERLRGGASPRR